MIALRRLLNQNVQFREIAISVGAAVIILSLGIVWPCAC